MMPELTDIVLGDALTELKKIEAESINLIVSSPPYNIGKRYEREQKRGYEEYLRWQETILAEANRTLAQGGSLCWQVGSFVRKSEIVPLDVPFYQIISRLGLKLRNRIIWRYNFGLNADKRFSGRYETLLWFTKGDDYKFNLDAVRVPQIYPGKRHAASRGALAGKPSGNPKGKNPSDFWEFSAERDFLANPVWDLPNVKNNHPEKTEHPCQFPVELAERCVLAFTHCGDLVLDPFVGTGSTCIAAERLGRRSIGIDRDSTYVSIARNRINLLRRGELRVRPSGLSVRRPRPGEKVATTPDEWRAE